MQNDKDLDALENGNDASQDEAPQEENLEWLLDMESGEEEDSLFKVEGEEYQDQGLSDLETEMAGRPMERGNAQGDDLANYVDEEIVISSEGGSSDIYADGDGAADGADQADESGKGMAIDFTRREDPAPAANTKSVAEGSDILGLASEDDMGETYFTIKRVKPAAAEAKSDVVARADSPAVEQEVVQSGAAASMNTVSAAAGSDVATQVGGDAELGQDSPSLDALEDAPVPTQVAEPDADAVANQAMDAQGASTDAVDEVFTDSDLDEDILFSIEEGEGGVAEQAFGDEDEVILFENIDDESDDFEAEKAVATAGADEVGSVDDYINELPEQLDDEAFDEYLLQGEHLQAGEADLEGFGIEESDDVLSLDVSGDVDIDYHEDFDQMGDVPRDLASEVAAVIPQVMDEISSAAEARLTQFGLSVESLQVEALMGTDEESVQRCKAEGYAPVSEVYPEVPRALAPFAEEERSIVFVRLLHSECGNESFNELFGANFKPLQKVEDGADTAADAATAETQDAVDGFGDDIFGDDFAEGLDTAFGDAEMEGASDIDAAFSSLSGSDDSEDEAICGIDVDAFDAADAASEHDTAAKADAAADEVEALGDQAAAELVSDAELQDEEEAVEALAEAEEEEEPAPASDIDFAALAALDPSDQKWCVPEGITFNESTQNGGEIFADFLDAFVEEGSAEIEKLEDLISEWEKDVASETISAEVGRTLHTVKGIAKGVGLQRYGTLVHNFETLLDALPTPSADEEQIYFRILNVWLDAVVRGIQHVGDKREDVASELPVMGGAAGQAAEEKPAPKAAKSTRGKKGKKAKAKQPVVTKEQEKQLDQQLADEGAKALAAQQSVRITSEKLDHLLNLTSQSQQLCVRASQSNNRGKRSTAELQGRLSSVRTHIGKIADRALLSVNARGNASKEMDALEMDQYSELQEAASILREGVEDLADLIELLGRQNNQVETLLKQQSSVISSISSSIQGARVVPVSRLMPGLRRIVRTVSTDLGKVVTFRVLNEIGALDRDHYSRLQVVLEHMVRNALDHGIESPDERLDAGKPNAGRITVDVAKSGGDYVIKLADDGRGIDPDAIRESAVEKGLDVDVDTLTDEEAMRLIFHKGFSTADTVSEISGRGVGMDIVLTELQQIGGDIQIQSAPGQGTTFEVRIPSNVTVNGALMVAAADDSYAIPLNGLIAIEQVPANEFFGAIRSGTMLQLFDMECEPAYLATLCQGVSLPERNFWESFVPVIIAGSDGRYMAIAIDHVEEALELVVRSLGNQFSTVPGLAGAATTADGEAIVALDLNLLVASVGADGIAPIADTREESQTLLALVVDDSRTQRMVATSQLDTVGVESVTAENGQVAIDLLNATHRLPDVVLLDVEMPVKDGMETLREIRKSQRYGHLPVIMVTSRTGAKHRALAKEAGCNAYMGKPFNFPALVEQINVLTGHNLQLT